MIRYSAADGIATLVLSRPPVNAIDAAFVAAFSEALDRAEADAITALVIVALAVWIIVTYRQRRREIERLEESGAVRRGGKAVSK